MLEHETTLIAAPPKAEFLADHPDAEIEVLAAEFDRLEEASKGDLDIPESRAAADRALTAFLAAPAHGPAGILAKLRKIFVSSEWSDAQDRAENPADRDLEPKVLIAVRNDLERLTAA